MKILTWQYNFLSVTNGTTSKEVKAKLEELGNLGWELVAIREQDIRSDSLMHKRITFIFKRPYGQITI